MSSSPGRPGWWFLAESRGRREHLLATLRDFGDVLQKKWLKSLRSELDLLTLTATPIPRTLNMAMSGMRDLSIIATPPWERHPIKTFVSQRNDALIVVACQRELKRGDQVYFLHNEVSSIERMVDQL